MSERKVTEGISEAIQKVTERRAKPVVEIQNSLQNTEAQHFEVIEDIDLKDTEKALQFIDECIADLHHNRENLTLRQVVDALFKIHKLSELAEKSGSTAVENQDRARKNLGLLGGLKRMLQPNLLGVQLAQLRDREVKEEKDRLANVKNRVKDLDVAVDKAIHIQLETESSEYKNFLEQRSEIQKLHEILAETVLHAELFKNVQELSNDLNRLTVINSTTTTPKGEVVTSNAHTNIPIYSLRESGDKNAELSRQAFALTLRRISNHFQSISPENQALLPTGVTQEISRLTALFDPKKEQTGFTPDQIMEQLNPALHVLSTEIVRIDQQMKNEVKEVRDELLLSQLQ